MNTGLHDFIFDLGRFVRASTWDSTREVEALMNKRLLELKQAGPRAGHGVRVASKRMNEGKRPMNGWQIRPGPLCIWSPFQAAFLAFLARTFGPVFVSITFGGLRRGSCWFWDG